MTRKKKHTAREKEIYEKIYQLSILINQYGQKAYHLNRRAARPKYIGTMKAYRWRQEARKLYRKADAVADRIDEIEGAL